MPLLPSVPLYLAAALRRIEAANADRALMQRAGRATAELAARLCLDKNRAILVLAGPGNNGGDAFEAAQWLLGHGFTTVVVFVAAADRLPPDAADAYRRFVDAGGRTQTAIPNDRRWSLIIDGLFGIGLSRDIGEPYAEMIRRANALARSEACPLLALDCPSGLDADTGRRLGETIRASHTLSFIAAKPGLFTADGPDYCGLTSVADLDIQFFDQERGHVVDRRAFANNLKPRALNSHKGSHGSIGILGGARGMVGAALLAGRAALRLGGGRVYLGLLDDQAPAIDVAQPELMLRAPASLLAADLTVLACGPGLGKHPEARTLLKQACQFGRPLVLDADALNLLADDGGNDLPVAARPAPTLLTPHPAEAARLLGCGIAEVQADRLRAARELSARFNASVALKGCGTVVCLPDGTWFINRSGNPGLATAGSGDVLTGVLAALLAQGWTPATALLGAVHLHGCAADRLVALGCGPIGLTASELIDCARHCLNDWITLCTQEPMASRSF